jgi:anthranilate/para-aminobenzoate synthase component I
VFELSPTTVRGWFGGRALRAEQAIEVLGGLSLQQAAAHLEEAFLAEKPALVAALVTYEGEAVVVHFDTESAVWDPVASDREAVPQDRPRKLLADARCDLEEDDYRDAVGSVRERILAGDVYVLNLTARLTGVTDLAPREAYAHLRAESAGEMSALLDRLPAGLATPAAIASVSPERFVRLHATADGRVAQIHPIKGTRPRGSTAEKDAALAAGLLGDEKERAEHVMVVDLERNDLGRIAVPGSVVVDPLYEVVPTPYCHQLVSTVRARLRDDASIEDLLEATFPCGSVTGAPKLAAMRIARELERSPRGAYCGALFVAVPGEMDSSVLIRTLEFEQDGPGVARWGSGCGITIDSDDDAEWDELELKASPVRRSR